MTPTWYDLLEVDPAASAEEIRNAWRAAVADLDPTDRRFQVLNEAAQVLLDPAAREAYDRGLARRPARARSATVAPGEPSVGIVRRPTQETGTPRRGWRRGGAAVVRLPLWLVLVLVVLAVLLAGAAAYVWTRPQPEDPAAVSTAQSTAERAATAILSYDYRTIDEGAQQARQYLTSGFRDKYDRFIDGVVGPNAPRTRTVVQAQVLASGIVRVGEDRVDVLVLVARPTTNAARSTPQIYRDEVTMRMVRQGDRWLVDDMVTTSAQD